MDWTRDWTVGLDSQKVALVILKHQTLLEHLHDMNGIRGGDRDSISGSSSSPFCQSMCANDALNRLIPILKWSEEKNPRIIIGLQNRQAESRNRSASQTWQEHRAVQEAANWLYVPLSVQEFASNDHHVFLEVFVRSWMNLHRNEVKLVVDGI